jgi:iron complex outermembrane receptor protein
MNKSKAWSADAVRAASSASMFLLAIPAAFAQEPQASSTTLEEVVITGSRIARSTFDTPTPVTVVGQEQIEARAFTNIAAALNDLPQFKGTTAPTTQGPSNFNVGAQEADLRGLGSNRTLVLVDGQRFVTNSNSFFASQAVDLNMIPTIMVERTEVATGGASAAYGSDAIGGVVNIILLKRFDGIKGQLQYGESDVGDNEESNAGVAFGSSFFNDRLHVVAGGEYSKSEGAGNCYSRRWCAQRETGQFTNPAGAFHVPGMPQMTIADHFHSAVMTGGGLIGSGPLAGQQFLPDGTTAPFQRGPIRNQLSMIGGEGLLTNQYSLFNSPVERHALYAHLEFDITPDLVAWMDVSQGRSEGTVQTTPPQDNGNGATSTICIRADNPFLPANVASAYAAINAPAACRFSPGVGGFTLGRYSNDLGYEFGHSLAETWRVATGLKGKLGGAWRWDASFMYGRLDNRDELIRDRIAPFFNWAVDAARDPATGQIVCRVQLGLTTADPQYAYKSACRPLNLFGVNRFSTEAADYAFGTNYGDTTSVQWAGNANVNGPIFDTWAGSASAAAGLEVRKIDLERTTDPFGDWRNPFNGSGDPNVATPAYFNQSYGGEYGGYQSVIEGYGEVNVPLARGAAFADSLELDLAARRTHYKNVSETRDTEGTVDATSWKAGLVWQPVQWLRLRATRSQDIRAPNTSELSVPGRLSAQGTAANQITNRATGQLDFPATQTGGSTDLRAEEGDTITVGAVFQPRWGWTEGLRFSVDYFKLELTDSIRAVPAQDVADRCLRGATEFCDGTIRDASGAFTYIFTGFRNLGLVTQKGYDLEASYRVTLQDVWSALNGTLNFRAIATITEELSTQSTADVVDRSDQTGGGTGASQGVPRYSLNGSVTYGLERFNALLQVRYIPSGRYDTTLIGPADTRWSSIVAQGPTHPLYSSTINDNTVDSMTIFNMGVRYAFGDSEGIEAYANVNNVFDTAPPRAPNLSYQTNTALFDALGREFRVGMRVRY